MLDCMVPGMILRGTSQMENHLQHIEIDIAAFAKFRTHPVLTAAQIDILDRYIARYGALAAKLRAAGYGLAPACASPEL
jgi:hypothetical protein